MAQKKRGSRGGSGKKKVMSVGEYIDRHYRLKMERDKIIAKLNQKKSEITELEEEALGLFNKESIESARGTIATGYIEEREVYKIEERNKLDAYVKRTGRFELFQNRVSSEAVRELEAQGKKVPGLSRIELRNFRTRKR